MTALVRKNLIPLLNAINANDDPNTGLLIQRGLRVWQESDKQDKKDLIEVIADIQPSELYQLAFDRWLLHTNEKANFATVSATVDGRLMTGLALGGTLETGVTTQHSYGMPMLAGSAVKGAVRAYAETLFSQKDIDGKIILIKDDKGIERSVIDPEMQPILDVLFGTDENAEQSNAGYLIWHDAWLIPALTNKGEYSSNKDAKPFVGEIVTVHHQKYYADKTGKIEALDMESPIPNQQLAVQGSFYFVLEGTTQWVAFAKQLLENMLTAYGMGAKGAAGYGYFEKFSSDGSKELNSKLEKYIEQLKATILKAEQKKAFEEELTQLSENQQLIKRFEANLPEQTLWKDKPNFDLTVEIDGKKYRFLEIYEIVKDWEEIKDISYALEFFERTLKVWTGKALSRNKNWKERLNPLKQKVGQV